MIFSDEEAKYLRAVLKWQERPLDDNRASWMLGLRVPERRPVGEFRILVIGAKGVGKTSILKKVRKRLSRTVERRFSSHRSAGSSAPVSSPTVRVWPRQAISTAADATLPSSQMRASTSSQICIPSMRSSCLWSTSRRLDISPRPSPLRRLQCWCTISPTRRH